MEMGTWLMVVLNDDVALPAIVGPMGLVGRVLEDFVRSANGVELCVDIRVRHVCHFDKFTILFRYLDIAGPNDVHVDGISSDVIAGQRGGNIAVGWNRQSETADHFICASFARLQIAMIPFNVYTSHRLCG